MLDSLLVNIIKSDFMDFIDQNILMFIMRKASSQYPGSLADGP